MLDVKTLSCLMLSFGSMSNKKLQKICYYIYSWYLTLYNHKIAPLKFEAWVHGPVSRELYNQYTEYGWEDIPQYKGFLLAASNTIEFAKLIWDVYGHYTADELEAMTHLEQPWLNARKGYKKFDSSDVQLNDNDIISFFGDKYRNSGHITA